MGVLVRVAALMALVGVAACSEQRLLGTPEAELGEFRLNVNYVFDENAVKAGHSRTVETGQWQTAITQANQARLGVYSGDRPVQLGVFVAGYTLGEAGIPIIYNPRSAVIADVSVYDERTKTWLARQHRIMVLESTDGESFLLGSGGSRTQQEQVDGLAFNLAKNIEDWLEEQHQTEGWFDPLPASVSADQDDLPVPQG